MGANRLILHQLPQSASVIKKPMNIPRQDSLSADLNVVNHVPIAKGLSQKKDASPFVVSCKEKLKYVKDVSCVNQLSFVKHERKFGCGLKSICRGHLEFGKIRDGPKTSLRLRRLTV